MMLRLVATIAIGLLSISYAEAQTVRFDTNVGNIDLILNPMNNGNLDDHVDNIIRYVNSGRYENVVLNRADTGGDANDPVDDFVLQFGGFTLANPIFSAFSDFSSVEAFDPVIVDEDGDGVVDFSTEDLVNTRGTVSLALSNSPNTGTSSFFVNIGDNLFLDNSGFVPFAQVADMSTVDYIMRLDQVSDGSAGLASSNIPVVDEDNFLVYVERAFVLDSDPVSSPASIATTPSLSTLLSEPPLEESLEDTILESAALEEEVPVVVPSLAVANVPEPPTLVVVVGVLMVLAVLKGPRLQG